MNEFMKHLRTYELFDFFKKDKYLTEKNYKKYLDLLSDKLESFIQEVTGENVEVKKSFDSDRRARTRYEFYFNNVLFCLLKNSYTLNMFCVLRLTFRSGTLDKGLEKYIFNLFSENCDDQNSGEGYFNIGNIEKIYNIIKGLDKSKADLFMYANKYNL